MLAVCVCFHTVEIHFGANGSSTDLPVFLTSGGPGCVCARVCAGVYARQSQVFSVESLELLF